MSEPETTAEPSGEASQTPVSGPGRLLSEARVRRNQTVAEVAQQLKLSPYQIEALEADDYARLPGPVFVRGFMRNYARLMELDGEALVTALGLPQEIRSAGAAVPPSHDIPFPGQGTRRWPIIAAAAATLAAIVALFEFVSAPSVPVPETPNPPLPQAEPSRPAAVTPVPVREAVVLPPPLVDASVPQPTQPMQPASQAESVAVPQAETRSSAARAGMARLHFVFKAQSWVEVRDRDDRVVFSQLNPAGAEQRIEGRAPLNIVIGNAHGVRLEFNGKAVDLAPHTKAEVTRLTLE